MYGKVKRSVAKRSARSGVYRDAYVEVFEDFGFEKVKLPAGNRPTYTEAYRRYGNCIVKTTRHVCAIINGKLLDTFDGRTYMWTGKPGLSNHNLAIGQTFERKAMSVWTIPDPV